MAVLFRIRDRVRLGVGRSRAQMKTFADDFSAANEHRADAWIGKRQARAELREFQRAVKQMAIGGHNEFPNGTKPTEIFWTGLIRLRGLGQIFSQSFESS
jgi:hypothetical protein